MKHKEAERDNLHAQQQAMSAMLHESMQQQQRQQAQLMQQIQLQNAALMALLSKQKWSFIVSKVNFTPRVTVFFAQVMDC